MLSLLHDKVNQQDIRIPPFNSGLVLQVCHFALYPAFMQACTFLFPVYA